MSRTPERTDEEFEILLKNHHISASELSERLPARSDDAVGIVRSGIHASHIGLDTSMLSKMMLSRLEGNSEGLDHQALAAAKPVPYLMARVE